MRRSGDKPPSYEPGDKPPAYEPDEVKRSEPGDKPPTYEWAAEIETHQLNNDADWQAFASHLDHASETSNCWMLRIGAQCPMNLVSHMQLPQHTKVLIVVQETASIWHDVFWTHLLAKADIKIVVTMQRRYDWNGTKVHDQKIVMRSKESIKALERDGLVWPLLPSLVCKSAQQVKIEFTGEMDHSKLQCIFPHAVISVVNNSV